MAEVAPTQPTPAVKDVKGKKKTTKEEGAE
jgi:hypothetical protein